MGGVVWQGAASDDETPLPLDKDPGVITGVKGSLKFNWAEHLLHPLCT